LLAFLILRREYYCFDLITILATGSCNQIQCSNGGTCFESSPGSSVLANCLCKSGYTGKFCENGE
jgi:hypothetical protein